MKIEYSLARQPLLETGSLIILTAHDAMQRRGDAAFGFVQQADFLYLTGIQEPGWLLVLNGLTQESCLVAPNRSEMQVVFEGGVTHEQAQELSGVESILTHKEGDALLLSLADQFKQVSTLGVDPRSDHYEFAQNPAPGRLLKKLTKLFDKVQDIRPILAKQRALKRPDEIAAIKQAIQATSQGFAACVQLLKTAPSLFEYTLEAELSKSFRVSGQHGHAYDPIVAAAKNACTLHYNQNSAEILKGEYVLIDAGAQLDGYAADVTRTYAFGEVSARAKQVHDAVLAAHLAIIDDIQPGLSFEKYQELSDGHVKRALISLGLIKDSEDESAYRRYFPHAISHGLGIDVHESLGGHGEFKPGMVFTVEPGIYISEESIGVRIEDDILITDTGVRNLTSAIPYEL